MSHESGLDSAETTRQRAEGELLDLLDRVSGAPWEHDFFATVRRLEVLATAAKGTAGVGRSRSALDDPVRFSQEPSLAFAPRTISAVKTRAGLTRLFVNFMGLMGPNGAMPAHFTEHARSRELHHNDPTLSRFLDVFNHRMVSLFYVAWAMNRPVVSRDRAAVGDERADRFAAFVGSLFGLGTESLRGRDSLPDESKLFFAGRLASQVRNAEGLAAVLREYFGVRVEIEEFVGRWSELPEEYRFKLGRKSSGRLGSTTIVGSRVWDCQSAVRLWMGPMSLAQYERLLPGGPGHARLGDWIRLYAGSEVSWRATLLLRKEEVPEPKLGGGIRLGCTTWMMRGKPAADPADVTLRSSD
jgi:type VI secretion system protein ImpH